MCVDKHHYKCCGCLSLTTATLILGALYLCGTIYYIVVGEWASFAVSLVISLLFILVLVKPHDANIRKILFYLISFLSIIGLLVLIIVFIVYLANDRWIDYCYDEYIGHDRADCLDNARTWMIISFIIAICLDLALVFCTLQILYFGWKEQEEGTGGAAVYN